MNYCDLTEKDKLEINEFIIEVLISNPNNNFEILSLLQTKLKESLHEVALKELSKVIERKLNVDLPYADIKVDFSHFF